MRRRRILNIIISLLLFCTVFVLCGKIMRYLVTDDTRSYTRVTFHELYEQDNIDVLFAGSSHCYRSFVPELLDRELGLNTFNAGTSSQGMDGSMMVIRETAKYNRLQHVYLELYFNRAFDTRKNRTQMTQTYIISDYLKASVGKLLFLLRASGPEHYANSFIVARRNWKNLFDPSYIMKLLKKKRTGAYKDYAYDYITGDEEWYAGKGYVANRGTVEEDAFFSTAGWEAIRVDEISPDWVEDLNRIMDYCEKEKIPLTLIGAPMPDFLLAGVGNYDAYISRIRELIRERDVDYYDFNLCRPEYFPQDIHLFKDTDHVNCYGAETFSRTFASLVNGDVSPEEMFYGSYQEKMERTEPSVLGVSYRDEADGQDRTDGQDGTDGQSGTDGQDRTDGQSGTDGQNILRHCRIVAAGAEPFEYEISVISEEGELIPIRGYSGDAGFTLDPELKGRCIIRYRNPDEKEKVQEVALTLPAG